MTMVNLNSSVRGHISRGAAGYSAQLSNKQNVNRKAIQQSRDRNRTQKAKTELSLTIWLFRWETLYHWFLFFQSLKCNSPKTVVHKKAKLNRAICLFRRKPLSHDCLCTLSIWNLIPLSEGHTFFLLCGLCLNLELNANNIKQVTITLIFITCLFRHCVDNLYSDYEQELQGFWRAVLCTRQKKN